jgi:hypothetical protein
MNTLGWTRAVFCLLPAGCQSTGYIYPPGGQPPPLANPGSYPCPVVTGTQGTCGGVHFLKSSLTCGGDHTMPVALSTIAGGGTRFNVQLQNDSTFSGELITRLIQGA